MKLKSRLLRVAFAPTALIVLAAPFIAFVVGRSTNGDEGNLKFTVVDDSRANDSRRAFLVGVNDYDKFSDLKYAVADVELLAEKLSQLGFRRENIVLLKTGGGKSLEPTKSNIERQFKRFLDEAEPDDALFVAFSGHGFQCSDFVGFAPCDAVPNSERTSIDFDSTFSLTDAITKLQASPAKFKWLIVDACRETISETKALSLNKGLAPLNAPPGILVLQSCSEGQFSREIGELKHGLFIAKLAEALDGKADADGDGVFTVYDVVKYASDQTKKAAEARGAKQTPRVSSTDLADFELGFNANSTPGQAPSPPPKSASEDGWGDSETRAAGTRKTITIKGVNCSLRWCPPGTFIMGSPKNEDGRFDWEAQRKATSRGFWMLETEVTQGLWKAVMKTSVESQAKKARSKPSFAGGFEHPMYYVSWVDCQDFIKELNRQKNVPAGLEFRLPTEEEWEYACRAGTSTAYFWGNALNGDKANCDGRYPCGTETKGKYLNRTSPVKEYEPNDWGLFDMHGNVWEWCDDRYETYPGVDEKDRERAVGAANRVIRGGSWDYDALSCRSACRNSAEPTRRSNRLGFRFVLSSSK